jgi:hypothetical protein
MAREEAPQGRDTEPKAFLRQQGLHLRQGHVPLRGEHIEDGLGVRLDPVRAAVTTLSLRSSVPCPAPQGVPANRAGRADTEPLCRLATGCASVNLAQHSYSQVHRQGCRHLCRPPYPADSLNPMIAGSGIPGDSVRSDGALGGGVSSSPVWKASPPAVSCRRSGERESGIVHQAARDLRGADGGGCRRSVTCNPRLTIARGRKMRRAVNLLSRFGQ